MPSSFSTEALSGADANLSGAGLHVGRQNLSSSGSATFRRRGAAPPVGGAAAPSDSPIRCSHCNGEKPTEAAFCNDCVHTADRFSPSPKRARAASQDDIRPWGRKDTDKRVYLLDPNRKLSDPVPRRFDASMVECEPNDPRRGTVISCLVFRWVLVGCPPPIRLSTAPSPPYCASIGSSGTCSRISLFSVLVPSPRPCCKCSPSKACWRSSS